MVVTPKRLAGEFGVTPFTVRELLRKKYGKYHGFWRFDEQEAVRVRRWLAKQLGRQPNGGAK